MNAQLRDVIGNRGEAIVELCLTDFRHYRGPLFHPAFLGEKWPSIDFYIELRNVKGQRPYFFAQVKTTGKNLSTKSKNLVISSTKVDVVNLLRFPGPTYLLGVHEPTKRVFIRSVHSGVPEKAITRIPLTHELTGAKLKVLYDEVRDFWAGSGGKPQDSSFK
jgi:Domain of unknown function (DUF4365)